MPMQNFKQPRSTGVTLVELITAVLIVGILTTMVLPSYQETTLRSGRAEGRTALMQVASEQERFFSNNNNYSTDAQPLANPPVETRDSITALWQVTVEACDTGTIANCFIATATAQGNQLKDSCDTITLSNTGLRGATGDTVDECWNR